MDSKIKYEELFDSISNCIAIYEAADNGNDFIFKDFNKAAEKADKIKREDLIGKSVLKVFPGVKDFGLFDIFKRVYKTGKPESYPISIYKDSRISGWRENYVYKLSNGNIVAVYNELTEKKKAEEALQKRENLLSKIFDILPVGLWLADKNGKLIRSNQKGREIWGAEPLVGQDQYGVFKARRLPSGEEIAPDDWALARSINSGETILDEMLEIDAFDGKKKIILNYTSPVLGEDGKVEAGIIVNLDITEQKIIQDALVESEEKYRTLVEKVNEAILIVQDGIFVFVNPRAQELMGIPEKDFVGKSFADFVWPEDREMVIANYRKRIAGETLTDAYDFRIIGAEGEPVWVFTSVALIQYEGKPATLIMVTNITDRKKVEQEIKNLARFPSENPNPVMRIDYEGRILYFNEACKSVPGWKQRAGNTTAKAIIERAFKAIKSKSDKTSSTIQFGNQIYELTIVNIQEYKYTNIYLKDITEKVNAEEALKKAIIEKDVIASAERIRMEKELHDSLSQTIFSTNLLADIIPSLWNKDRQEALKQLEKIKLLTKESQYQFRRILLGLKPDAFLLEDLGDLIRQLAYSLQVRSEIPVEVSIKGKHNPSKEVKEAFYRICQEALNNIIKYSCANMVKIELECLPEKICLRIKDNGMGFDKKKVSQKSLGLYIMRKRAKDINAALNIDSKIGRGTKIAVKL